ncbi:MAG: hypothetical protein ACOYK8_02970 [Alphaproteobacteria bacterium]
MSTQKKEKKREEKLAKALRDNLIKRKELQRHRAEKKVEPSAIELPQTKETISS